jgi:predicted DNA binding CopG/RHH family protein
MQLPANAFEESHLHVRLPSPLLEEIKDVAREKGIPLSVLIRTMIKTELASNGRTVSVIVNLV